MAAADARLVGITPAMREGSGLVRFSEEYPKRYFDVGIAEQHALTFAAGMACEGVKPVVAIYSTFLQRAYDQLIHDIALQDLPVMLAIDRAGLVGADGPTHAGSFDLSFLSCIPNMLIAAPSDENECRRLLSTAFLHGGPSAVRYPRGSGSGVALDPGLEPFEIGKGKLRRNGGDIALIAFGSLVAPTLEAAEALDASVADMRFVKPLDVNLLRELARSHRLLVTLEENAIIGGAGMACAEALAELGLSVPVLHLGLPDTFIEHGDPLRMLAACGLDAVGIERSVRHRITLLPE
jgi:1-deoxy-D-xylulose-5-phosphate synthase